MFVLPHAAIALDGTSGEPPSDDLPVDALVLGDSRVAAIHRNGTLGELRDRRIHGAATEALPGTWPIAALGGVGLATDGAWRGRHLYQEIPPWPMLAKRIEFLAPKALLVAVQEAENNDPVPGRWGPPSRRTASTACAGRRPRM